MADLYVLLATLDVSALKNLRLTLDMLDVLGYPRESWRLVLNRSDSKVGLTQADVEATLKMALAARIPSSRAVAASLNKGLPLTLEEPGHPVSVAIRQLAEDLVRSRRDPSGSDADGAARSSGRRRRPRRPLAVIRHGGQS